MIGDHVLMAPRNILDFKIRRPASPDCGRIARKVGIVYTLYNLILPL